MLERLVPSVVAIAETRVDIDFALSVEEARALDGVVEKRRREFVTGRACARQALSALGVPAEGIPRGQRGEPLWPPGVVGSITHCDGYRGCAVARRDDIIAVGIDAEVNAPLPAGVFDHVAIGSERELSGTDGSVHLDRLLFSAKESVYKAWFPLTRRWLGFKDAELALDVSAQTFRARLLVPGPRVLGTELTELSGRWLVEGGLVCTAVVL
jgi:4'-phosphopantetheinyl transferase EntD